MEFFTPTLTYLQFALFFATGLFVGSKRPDSSMARMAAYVLLTAAVFLIGVGGMAYPHNMLTIFDLF